LSRSASPHRLCERNGHIRRFRRGLGRCASRRKCGQRDNGCDPRLLERANRRASRDRSDQDLLEEGKGDRVETKPGHRAAPDSRALPAIPALRALRALPAIPALRARTEAPSPTPTYLRADHSTRPTRRTWKSRPTPYPGSIASGSPFLSQTPMPPPTWWFGGFHRLRERSNKQRRLERRHRGRLLRPPRRQRVRRHHRSHRRERRQGFLDHPQLMRSVASVPADRRPAPTGGPLADHVRPVPSRVRAAAPYQAAICRCDGRPLSRH
jgi:hypothetical protein